MGAKLIGLERLNKKLQTLPENARKGFVAELQAGSQAIRNDAVSLAPVDEGLLKKSIQAKPLQGERSGGQVGVNAYYGGYVEFGTGKKVNRALVNKYPEAANAVRNLPKRGNFKDFVKSIYEWALRKGVLKKTRSANRRVENISAAYGLAFRILQNGIESQPYFFRAYEKNQRNIVKKCGQALAKAIRQS